VQFSDIGVTIISLKFFDKDSNEVAEFVSTDYTVALDGG